MDIGFSLSGSTLDAKGGVFGGTINTYIHTFGKSKVLNKLDLALAALELRLDYMRTSVMKRIGSLNVALRDEWKCSTEINRMLPNERPTVILIHCDLS